MTSEVAVVRHESVGDTVLAGALAGAIGGVLFLAAAMIDAAMGGLDILSPIRLIGATFVGSQSLEGAAATIALGLTLHIVTAMTWGIVFAAILPRVTSIAAALVAGLAFGLVVMLLMLYLVLPFVNPLMHQAVDGTNTFMFAHLLYGAALSLVPILRHRFAAHVD